MAITTAADLVTEIQGHYRGADSTTIASYLSLVMDEICKDFPIVVDKVSLQLTADTGEYSLASGSPWRTYQLTTTATATSLVRIESAHYVTDANSRTALIPTTVQKLDVTPETCNWRYESSGTPKYIFTTPNSTGGYSVGLYPSPDTASSVNTTTAAYEPRIDFVYRKKIGSTFSGTVTIPSSITDFDIFTSGVLWYIYKRENNGEQARYYELYVKAKANLADELSRRHREYRPNITNSIAAPRGV